MNLQYLFESEKIKLNKSGEVLEAMEYSLQRINEYFKETVKKANEEGLSIEEVAKFQCFDNKLTELFYHTCQHPGIVFGKLGK